MEGIWSVWCSSSSDQTAIDHPAFPDAARCCSVCRCGVCIFRCKLRALIHTKKQHISIPQRTDPRLWRNSAQRSTLQLQKKKKKRLLSSQSIPASHQRAGIELTYVYSSFDVLFFFFLLVKIRAALHRYHSQNNPVKSSLFSQSYLTSVLKNMWHLKVCRKKKPNTQKEEGLCVTIQIRNNKTAASRRMIHMQRVCAVISKLYLWSEWMLWGFDICFLFFFSCCASLAMKVSSVATPVHKYYLRINIDVNVTICRPSYVHNVVSHLVDCVLWRVRSNIKFENFVFKFCVVIQNLK